MKGLRFPLWLICDAAAALRLALATLMLSLQVRLHWPKHAVTAPTPEGIAQITVWLSFAEAMLRWAITRQALRTCGLDPSTARIFLPREAASSFTWQVRCRTFLRLLQNMSRYARRWASRIRAALAKTSSGVTAQPVVASSSRRFSKLFRTAPTMPAGQRIRAPPWLTPTADCRLPTADCLAASASEVAGV